MVHVARMLGPAEGETLAHRLQHARAARELADDVAADLDTFIAALEEWLVRVGQRRLRQQRQADDE